MASDSTVGFSSGLPETVLPDPPPDAEAALKSALAGPADQQRDAIAAIAAAHPRYLEAWARLAEITADEVEAYAYARVGYHRGLDALRGSGWRGSGYVRWQHPSNRGLLLALDQLSRRAGAIGETDEEERCQIFLRQLEPNWDRRT